jgi:hypothetical protein
LCNLCNAVCPEKLEIGNLFYAIRWEAMDAGKVNLSRYRTILGSEKRGSSPLFSYDARPEGCDTVFLPGCTLPGTRPETTWQIFKHLHYRYPTLGIVLDCCTNLSHDPGRRNYFEYKFGKLRQYLLDKNIRMLLVACPSCYKFLKSTVTDWRFKAFTRLSAPRICPPVPQEAERSSCMIPARCMKRHSARSILTRMGLSLSEMKHHGKLTVILRRRGKWGVCPSGAGIARDKTWPDEGPVFSHLPCGTGREEILLKLI